MSHLFFFCTAVTAIHSPQLHGAPRLAPWASSPIYLVSIHFCPSGFPGSAPNIQSLLQQKHPENWMGKYSHWVPKIAIFPAIFQNWVPKNKNAGNIAMELMELMEPKTENRKFRARDAPWYLSRMTSKSCTQHATFPERTRQFPTSEQKQV